MDPLTLAGSVLGPITQGLSSTFGVPSAAPTGVTDAGGVYIAPTAVNFGEILQPYNEGPIGNGGYPTTYSRYVSGLAGVDVSAARLDAGAPDPDGDAPLWPWLLAGLGGVVVLAIAMKGR